MKERIFCEVKVRDRKTFMKVCARAGLSVAFCILEGELEIAPSNSLSCMKLIVYITKEEQEKLNNQPGCSVVKSNDQRTGSSWASRELFHYSYTNGVAPSSLIRRKN